MLTDVSAPIMSARASNNGIAYEKALLAGESIIERLTSGKALSTVSGDDLAAVKSAVTTLQANVDNLQTSAVIAGTDLQGLSSALKAAQQLVEMRENNIALVGWLGGTAKSGPAGWAIGVYDSAGRVSNVGIISDGNRVRMLSDEQLLDVIRLSLLSVEDGNVKRAAITDGQLKVDVDLGLDVHRSE